MANKQYKLPWTADEVKAKLEKVADIDKLNSSVDSLTKNTNFDPVEEDIRFAVKGKYINYQDGRVYDGSLGPEDGITDYIVIQPNMEVTITLASNYNTSVCSTYDRNQNFIRSYYSDGTDKQVTNQVWSPTTDDEYYVRFGNYSGKAWSIHSKYVPTLKTQMKTIQESLTYVKRIDISDDVNIHNGYWTNNGEYREGSDGEATDYIPCADNDLFIVSGLYHRWAAAGIITFDASKKFLRSYLNESQEGAMYNNYEWSPAADEKYVIFSTYLNFNLKVLKDESITVQQKIDDLQNAIENPAHTGNPLWGKKLVVCGDSFSAKFEYLPDGPYGQIIAARNNMTYVDLARAGHYIHYTGEDASFTNTTVDANYTKIPTDADYIILSWGLNETSGTLGELTSADNTTYYGAFNEVLNWIQTNAPQAKVLLISQDQWMPENMRDAQEQIAHYWGVSFLDFKGPDVPLFAGGKFSSDGWTINETAKNNKNKLYQHSDSDTHPNQLAHHDKSTVVEAALKRI